MKQRPFLVFMAIVGTLIGGTLWFFQTPQFARLFKNLVSQYLPADLGVDSDFSEFALQMFPPGISFQNPTIKLREHNIAQLPPGSSVQAERIEVNFHPFQMFSGNIRIHEVVVVNGEVNLILDQIISPRKAQKKEGESEFHWDELLQVHAEAIVLQNTRVFLKSQKEDSSISFLAQGFRLGQWSGKGGLGYELMLDLSEVKGKPPKDWPLPESLSKVSASAHINALSLQVESLSFSEGSIEVSLSGTVKGNILNPRGLIMDSSLNVHGEVQDLLRFAKLGGKTPIDAEGKVSFTGKARGNLERIAETLRAEGTLIAKNGRFQKWRFDRLKTEGTWTASAKGGEIALSKVSLLIQERAGFPSKVEIDSFKFKPGSIEPVQARLRLEKVHIHWLAAPELKTIYPLNFYTNGGVDLSFSPETSKGPWTIHAGLQLDLTDFQLDNQKLGEVNPLHRILRIPKVHVEGPIVIDPVALKPANVSVEVGHSKFKATGKVDFATGWDLFASGQIDLADIGQLAETNIRGLGTLNVHIRGPLSRTFVDFDPDLKNAEYLNLKFGDLKGRITYDDAPTHLIFTKLQALKGRTNYQGDGMLDLGKSETIALAIKVPNGDIQDFFQIFENLTRELWWLPRSLNGPVSGEVQISGGIDLKQLEVVANLKGIDWEYVGERFEKVAVTGGYDKGRFHISYLDALKHAGKVTGRISFDSYDQEKIDWEMHSHQFIVSDLDHVAQLDVPIRGKLSFDSVGKGRLGAVWSASQAHLTDLAVRGMPMPPSQVSLKTEAGVTVIRAIAFGGQGTGELTYDFKAGAPSYLRGELKRFDFSPILLLLNPREISDPALAGLASGSVNISFRSGLLERLTGDIQISEYLLAKTGAKFQLSNPVSLKVADGSFNLRDLSLEGGDHIATLNLTSDKSNIEGSISGQLDLSLVEFFTSSIAQASGAASLDFDLGGNLKDPTILGRATVDGASVRVAALDSPFENITGTFQLKQNVLLVQNLEADLASGRITSNGNVTVYADRYPEIALKAMLSGNKIKVYPFQFVKVRGEIGVRGNQLPYLVNGSIVVDSALSKEKVFQQKQAQGLKAIQYLPPPSARRLSDYPKFRLKIEAHADGGILVQNDLFTNMELKGHVTIVNTLEAPRILGNAEMIQGNLIFKDRKFQILSATAVFDNPTVIDPRLTMTSTTEVNNVKVQLYASGRMNNLKFEFTSNPVMPEPEILSLLALGLTQSEAKKLSSSDRSVFEQGEGVSLILNSLDFNRDIENKTGFQINLDESVNFQQGSSIFRPQRQAESAAAPKIVIRRQITKNVDISYGNTVGVGTTTQSEVNAEIHVTPGFSVLGVWNNYGATEAESKQQSYGLDLKLQKRFR